MYLPLNAYGNRYDINSCYRMTLHKLDMQTTNADLRAIFPEAIDVNTKKT